MKTTTKEIREYSSQNNLPFQIAEVYTVAEIQKILKISRAMSYDLANSGSFPIIKIGKSIRIPAKTFQEWLYNNHGFIS